MDALSIHVIKTFLFLLGLRSDILEQVHMDMNRIREQVNEPMKEARGTTSAR